jgi:hypothetical protein
MSYIYGLSVWNSIIWGGSPYYWHINMNMKDYETYGEICQRIADWLLYDTHGRIDLTANEIFELDQQFPALAIEAFARYLDAGQNALDVLVSDAYCSKLILRKMDAK